MTQRVDDTAEHFLADGHRGNPAGALDGISFADLVAFTEEDATHIVLFKVQHHAEHAMRKLDELAHERLCQAVHTGNAITDLQDRPDVVHVGFFFETCQLLSQNCRYLIRSYFCHWFVLSCL